ncbi:P-loop guanosine triphosphatase YjiA [Rubrobacter xylanophilus DSM 9941]|uniref:CobW family GTP-binding protein n=1 Tax=Rubrobacter xylanophilus TaxID=49319 RepID=UPI001C63F7DA|nr:GTP-binding protein [Rubrobacter xylanophilus]QYJ15786.1 P-loop guanosine triphosphatase YjiA [Rubrobacter xylanophilus DSM 9941]
MAIPVTVVTGFLGSGKTTLLSRVLREPELENTAVIVNEFGEVGLDHHLLRPVAERTLLLGSGCVCCSEREDLVAALGELLDLYQRGEIPALDRVVIETTGLADPAPILHTVFSHPVLSHHFTVDLVITTVDAINGAMQLEASPEATKQVAASDEVVITKTDLAGPGAKEELKARIRAINPPARIVEASFGELDVRELLSPEVRVGERDLPRLQEHDTASTHTVSVTFDGPVDWTAFGIWLSMLLHARGESVLRVKGLLDTGGPGPVVLNGVQHVIHPPQHLERWPDRDRSSRLVFITRDIPEESLLASLGGFRGLLGARVVPLGERVSSRGGSS